MFGGSQEKIIPRIRCLKLFSTEFLQLSNILWFFIYDFDNDDEFEIITSDPLNSENMKYYNIDTLACG